MRRDAASTTPQTFVLLKQIKQVKTCVNEAWWEHVHHRQRHEDCPTPTSRQACPLAARTSTMLTNPRWRRNSPEATEHPVIGMTTCRPRARVREAASATNVPDLGLGATAHARLCFSSFLSLASNLAALPSAFAVPIPLPFPLGVPFWLAAAVGQTLHKCPHPWHAVHRVPMEIAPKSSSPQSSSPPHSP